MIEFLIYLKLAKAVDECKTKSEKLSRDVEALRNGSGTLKESNPKMAEENERLHLILLS